MATRIIEYNSRDHRMPVFEGPSITEQTALVATSTSQQSAAFNAGTNMVCVQSDESVYVKFGENPTATGNCYRINAGGEYVVRVNQGGGLKVAVKL